MASSTNALVPLLTLVAAMGGGALGAAFFLPERVHEPVGPDLTALTGLVDELRHALAQLGADRSPMVQPASRLEHREPYRQEAEQAEPMDHSELDELRSLVAELRLVVETGIPAADPPPILEFHSARPMDSEAVREAIRRGMEENRKLSDDLMYLPYQDVLSRFGRPSYVGEKGEWAYSAAVNEKNWADRWYAVGGIQITIREGHVTSAGYK